SRKPESRRNANETDDEGWGWTVGLGAALVGAAAWGAASWYNSRNEEAQPRSHVQTSAPIRHVHTPTYTPAEPAQTAEAPPTAEEEETFLADDYNGWEHPGNCTSRARKSEAIQQYRDAVESRIYAPRRNGRAGAALTRLEAIIQFDKHKRENGEAARQAFKKRSLLEVPMPSGFESTCAILDNNEYQGLLHTILRHSPEWKDFAPGYANIYQRLSEQTRAAISKIAHLPDNEQKRAQQMIKEFKKSLGTMPANDCKTLQNLQGIIYDYLCKTINIWNYAGEGANPSDFVQFFFQESGNASIGYMVVCISKTVDALSSCLTSILRQRPTMAYATIHADDDDAFLADLYGERPALWEHPPIPIALQQAGARVSTELFPAFSVEQAKERFRAHKRENAGEARETLKTAGLLVEFWITGAPEGSCIRSFVITRSGAPEATRDKIDEISAIPDDKIYRAKKLTQQYLSTTLVGEDCIALQRLQSMIYEYILKNAVEANYRDSGINPNGYDQYYFEVGTGRSKRRYMAICLAEQTDDAVENFNDPRGIRTIITIFFVQHVTYTERVLKKVEAERDGSEGSDTAADADDDDGDTNDDDDDDDDNDDDDDDDVDDDV
ncbi:unnamed protein product, partial [Mesorhabditis spiculigera]